MAKKLTTDLKRVWICEECGTPHSDRRDPPDGCEHCGYTHFENLFDLEKEHLKKQAADRLSRN